MARKNVESRLAEKVTTPVEQALFGSPSMRSWTLDYLRTCSAVRPAAKTLQERLGRQDFCYFNGEFRFRVWERLDGKSPWRLFHHPVKGLCLEVPEGASPEDAWAAWEDFKKAVRV